MSDGRPAGWYDDPTMVNTRRYWDGERWTDQIVEAFPGTAPAETSVASGGSGWRRPAFLIPLTLVVLIGVGVGIYLAVRGGDGDAAPKKDTFQVRGTFTINDNSGVFNDGSTCEGTGGYDDLVSGAQITIRDEKGKSLALGQLDDGHPVTGESCVFEFEIDKVPSSGSLYSIEVTHRGQISFKKADADTLSLSIG